MKREAQQAAEAEMRRLLQRIPEGGEERIDPAQLSELTASQRTMLCALVVNARTMGAIRLLMKSDYDLHVGLCFAAVRAGDKAILAELQPYPCDVTHTAVLCHVAAAHGRVPIMRSMLEVGLCDHWNSATPVAAARGGHVDMLRWLLEESDCDANNEAILVAAAETGHLPVLEYMHDWALISLDATVLYHAAVEHDQAAVLQWLKGREREGERGQSSLIKN